MRLNAPRLAQGWQLKHAPMALASVLIVSGCATAPTVTPQQLDALFESGDVPGALNLVAQSPVPADLSGRRTLAQLQERTANRYRTSAARLVEQGDDAKVLAWQQKLIAFPQLPPALAQAQREVANALQAKQWSDRVAALGSSPEVAACQQLMAEHRRLLPSFYDGAAAQRLKELSARCPQSQPVDAKSALAALSRKPLTLELRQAPLSAVLSVFSQQLNVAFIADPAVDVTLRANVSARDQPAGAVVASLLTQLGLAYRTDELGNIVVSPKSEARGAPTADHAALQVRHADPKFVAEALKQLTPIKDYVVDERLSTLHFSGAPGDVELAKAVARSMDLPTPEVMLEVEIFEIKRSRLQELGIRPPGQLTLSASPGSDDILTLRELRKIDSSTTTAALGSAQANLRKELQDGEVLANPRIRVRNREKAKVLIGDRIPIITTTSTSTGFVSESVSYVDVGIKLEVSPDVNPDRNVSIRIDLDVSSLVKEVLTKSGSLSYQIGTRSASTSLQLKDGETQVLAGLISDEERVTHAGLPWLGSIPVLGRLFSSKKDDAQRSEILLSITPRVIQALESPAK
jgi:general secretion pathway protein D